MKKLLLLGLFTICCCSLWAQSFDLAVGTYTVNTSSHGIYFFRFNSQTGEGKKMDSIAAINPSFLQVNRKKNRVWAVQEVVDQKGALRSFTLPAKISGHSTASPVENDSLPTLGDAPCHISLDKEEKFAFVSNYVGGNLSVFALDKKGKLVKLVQLIQHQGKSANAQRQNGPHVHSAFFSPDQKWLWVQDLGTDEVVAYPYDAQNKTQPLSEKGKRVYKAQAGSGPRHLAFHPRLPMAYVLEELTGTIAVLSTNLSQPGAVPLLQQSIAMVDAKDKGKTIGAADIHLSADGRFLYASNRGDFNELVQYAIQPNGQLSFVARYATQGIKPRNFTLSPDGKWLLVAHQNSHNIVVFRRDTQTGLLENSGQILQVGAPVCLFFLP